MFGAVLCLLFGFANSQRTYFLGDNLSIRIDANPFGFSGLRAKIVQVYIKFPEMSGTNTIDFIHPNVTVDKGVKKTIPLYSQFGSQTNPMELPATAMGLAQIHAVGEHLTVLKDIIVENVTIARHVVPSDSSGRIEMWGQRSLTFNVEYSGTPTANLSDPAVWVVSLMQSDSANNGHFKVFDNFTVTSVMPPSAGSPPFYTLVGQWKTAQPTPMTHLYFLVGVKNGSNPMLNTYAITGNSMSAAYSWVIVNDKFKVTAPAKVPEWSLAQITLNSGGLPAKNNYFWLIANNGANGNRYALGCSSMEAASYGNFEWKTLPIASMENTQALPIGQYSFEVVWTDKTGAQKTFMDTNYPIISTNTMMDVQPHGANQPTPIMFNRAQAQKLGALTRNQNLSVDVYSIFNTIWIQWFKETNKSYVNKSNGANTTGWRASGDPIMVSIAQPGVNQTVHVLVPESVFLNNVTGKTATTARLYGWTHDCNGNHFAQHFANGNLTQSGGSSGTGSGSKLGAGAIVGIVCAVVFVCGVAAWWLCMKNSSGTDRYQKLDGN